MRCRRRSLLLPGEFSHLEAKHSSPHSHIQSYPSIRNRSLSHRAMKTLSHLTSVAAALICVSAYAADATMSVSAKVPDILEAVDMQDRPLSGTNLVMSVDPATGTLRPTILPFKIRTNNDKDRIEITIQATSKNPPTLESESHTVALAGLIDRSDVVARIKTIAPKDIFPSDDLQQSTMLSNKIELQISARDNEAIPAGNYSGKFVLVVRRGA